MRTTLAFALVAVVAVAGNAFAQEPFEISTPMRLPRASLGQSYGHVLDVSGGTSPLSWSVVGGALPDGLFLPADVIISGNPADLGRFPFSARAIVIRPPDQGGPPRVSHRS